MSKRPLLDARIAEIVAGVVRDLTPLVQAEIERAGGWAAAPASTVPAQPSRERSRPPASSQQAARKPHPLRSYTDAEVEAVFGLIASRPGLRTEQIKEAIGGDDAAVQKILERLRARGRVTTTGIKRAMAYSAVGAVAVVTPASSVDTRLRLPTVNEAPPPPRAIAPTQPAATNIVDQVRDDLHAAYEGRPVSPDRLAFRLKADRDLVDAALTLLVKRREAKAMGARGKIGYVPYRVR